MDWIDLVQDRNQWMALMNTVWMYKVWTVIVWPMDCDLQWSVLLNEPSGSPAASQEGFSFMKLVS
jgi:hypothetical protein